MLNKFILSSDFNFSSGYKTLLYTIINESHKRKIGIIPKIYNKPSDDLKSVFDLNIKQDGNEHELALFPAFNYPDYNHYLTHLFDGKNKTYFTMWEASRIGDFFIDKINTMDCVIVPNEWNRQCFIDQGCKTDIKVVNLGIDTEIFKYSHSNDDDIFTFGTGNNDPRKRLTSVIKCFTKAFPNKKDVRLKIKVSNKNINMFIDNRIIVDYNYYSPSQLKSWYDSIDVFVSGVSAEGWGYMQHESMSCGRPVICANYGGLKEFINEKNSFCLDYQEVDATGFWEFPGAKWSLYDEDDMIETMRYCYQNRSVVKQKGLVSSEDVAKLSNLNFAKNLFRRLQKTSMPLGSWDE